MFSPPSLLLKPYKRRLGNLLVRHQRSHGSTACTKHGIPIRFIQISGLRGKGIKALLGAPFAILRAVLQARKIIQEYQT